MSTDRTDLLGSELNAVLGPDERAKLDALLDHIYEYSTNSEGVLRLAAQLCQAARADERERCLNEWNGLLLELRQMADDSADRGDVFAQRVVALLSRT